MYVHACSFGDMIAGIGHRLPWIGRSERAHKYSSQW